MSYCPACDRQRGGRFCSICGACLSINPYVRACPWCGIDGITSNDMWCYYCGHKLIDTDPPLVPLSLMQRLARRWRAALGMQ